MVKRYRHPEPAQTAERRRRLAAERDERRGLLRREQREHPAMQERAEQDRTNSPDPQQRED